MEDISKLKNVEAVINKLKEYELAVSNYKKYDGITFECETTAPDIRNATSKIVQQKCVELGLAPVSIELRKDSDVLFGVQFPEMIPEYSNEEITKMYKDTFYFLFDNMKSTDPSSVTKPILIENMSRLTKHAITTYCRSNINQYKENAETYLNNSAYRAKIDGIFLESVDSYLSRG